MERLGAVIGERIAVIGLGYVGLPVAMAFSEKCLSIVGFDISKSRVALLKEGHDETGEFTREQLLNARIRFSDDPSQLLGSSLFIVTVPTPVDVENRPDLRPLREACRTIGPYLSTGCIVVFESTVYPGATEEICGPLLEQGSGLRAGREFSLGYSPERINPGDQRHSIANIIKVVSAQNESALERIAFAYQSIITAGVHRAPSIRVAEAAKVIENIQRDINIALMNELSLIFDRLNIRTTDVINAASTKWNFMKFQPGLVGGHCIGIDPYYLTAKAESVGYHPEVILAGRRINDSMARFVAQKTLKLLAKVSCDGQCRVGVLGLTFKEDVPDLRNSKVVDLVRELQSFGVEALVFDPIASTTMSLREYGIRLCKWEDLRELDAVVLAVPHKEIRSRREQVFSMIRKGGVLMDLKATFDRERPPDNIQYWSL